VLGLVDATGEPVGHADWREYAARAAAGTVFDQPEPEESSSSP